jgi:hypothetical protein
VAQGHILRNSLLASGIVLLLIVAAVGYVGASGSDTDAKLAVADRVVDKQEAAADPETPSEMTRLINLTQVALHDVKAVIDAVQAQNEAAVNMAAAALDKAGKELDSVDDKKLQAQYDALGKKYDDRTKALIDEANAQK